MQTRRHQTLVRQSARCPPHPRGQSKGSSGSPARGPRSHTPCLWPCTHLPEANPTTHELPPARGRAWAYPEYQYRPTGSVGCCASRRSRRSQTFLQIARPRDHVHGIEGSQPRSQTIPAFTNVGMPQSMTAKRAHQPSPISHIHLPTGASATTSRRGPVPSPLNSG